MVEWSQSWTWQSWTWIDGDWHEGNPPTMGPHTHAAWLGSSVFDGARAFEGVMPDLDLHCQRVNRSAEAMGLLPSLSAQEIVDLAHEGQRRFKTDTALYIRPMYWAEEGGYMTVAPKAESTRFCLCLYEAPMPAAIDGFSITLSKFRRPTLETMPMQAKAGCLYPNNARALMAAKQAGFDNAVMLDQLGNVAELATANLFMVKNGEIFTPAANGTFLNGITRQRVISLLRDAGYAVHESTLNYQAFYEADEIFSTGNYLKVAPITQIDSLPLNTGPLTKAAQTLYWDFAHASSSKQSLF